MNHDQFDEFTRSLATGISRRQALKLLGGLLASAASAFFTGRQSKGKSSSQEFSDSLPLPTSSASSDCGTCETCIIDADTETISCGIPCEEPCMAELLFEQARQDSQYQQLIQRLDDMGFIATAKRRALIIPDNQGSTESILQTSYLHDSTPGKNAILYYHLPLTEASTSFALVLHEQLPRYVLVIDDDGQIEQVATPDVQSTSISVFATARYPLLCKICTAICDTGDDSCALVAMKKCGGVKPAWAYGLCIVGVMAACHIGGEGCKALCDQYLCSCPPDFKVCGTDNCCSPCHDCKDGQCVLKPGCCCSSDQCLDACPQDYKCKDGMCVPITCEDPCSELINGICVAKECSACEFCNKQDGMCWTRCTSCQRCEGGRCVSNCPPCHNCVGILDGAGRATFKCRYCSPGTSCCKGECVNLANNNQNCGACGNNCNLAQLEVCENRRCRRCEPRHCELFVIDPQESRFVCRRNRCASDEQCGRLSIHSSRSCYPEQFVCCKKSCVLPGETYCEVGCYTGSGKSECP